VIAKQVRMGNGWYNAQYHEKPPFDLPVVYEDDHFAIVNKPAGVVTYAHRGAGHGRMSVKSALPFVVKAPKAQTFSVISRPIACHRLDKPTSGLLVVAKTKPAMVHLTQQFAERKVKKTYTAIVNGIPDEAAEATMTSKDAHQLGLDVNPDDESSWQVINFTLDDKHAITAWRPIRYVKSLKARNGVLTLVELKPNTGRYHQLRRHMAWVCDCPLVGDKTYDGGGDAMAFRERGLFLCSNRVTMEHPYYNTDVGRQEWETLDDEAKFAGGMLSLSQDGIVRVTASIDLPTKFESFLTREKARSSKFQVEESADQ
jgi:23S rRNA-/tRNA-specific pseudouridylate synthase